MEAMLLLASRLAGTILPLRETVSISLNALLLCFTMGLSNAPFTTIANAEMRTRHITGLVTDIGIKLGKLIYWNRKRGVPSHLGQAHRTRLRVHSALALSFLSAGNRRL